METNKFIFSFRKREQNRYSQHPSPIPDKLINYSRMLNTFNNQTNWDVVVAQLVERSLATPEFRGLNPAIGKIYIEQCLLSTVLKRRK